MRDLLVGQHRHLFSQVDAHRFVIEEAPGDYLFDHIIRFEFDHGLSFFKEVVTKNEKFLHQFFRDFAVGNQTADVVNVAFGMVRDSCDIFLPCTI